MADRILSRATFCRYVHRVARFLLALAGPLAKLTDVYPEVVPMKTVNQLRKYRQQCERETGQVSGEITVSLNHVLADVCRALKIPSRQQRRVLGRRGGVQLSDMRRWCVSLTRNKAPRKS
jgi:hypothetical protein